MMDIKLTKCMLCSIVNDCVVQKRNHPRLVPPHRQESCAFIRWFCLSSVFCKHATAINILSSAIMAAFSFAVFAGFLAGCFPFEEPRSSVFTVPSFLTQLRSGFSFEHELRSFFYSFSKSTAFASAILQITGYACANHISFKPNGKTKRNRIKLN